MLYGIDKNSDFKENVTCFHDDSIKSSAFISKNNNERNHGQFKSCYPEILKKYILTSKLKQLKKKLKYCSLHKQNFEISEKLMNIMSDKEIAKEVTDFLLKRYRKGGDLPPKLASLLESALPPCSVNETVFPVFISSKENSGINESSGYSSNEDSHLRPPMRSQNAAVSRSENKSQGEIALKSNAKQRAAENDKCELSWMKDIKLNGRKDFNQNIGSSSSRTNNVDALEHSVNRLKGINGISQNTGPHKCTKCKRLYRTNESFEKHCESCNFFVDSSSTEEESSDSSDGSDESYESSSDENIPKELNRISLKQPIPSSIDKNFTTNKHFTNSIVNNSISNVCYKSGILNKKQVEGNLTSSPKVQSSHANSSRIQSNHISSSTIQSSPTNSPRMQSSRTKIPRTQSNQKGNSLKSSFKGKPVPLKSYGSLQNNINPNQYQQTQNLNIPYQQTSNSVPTIQYGTVAATSDRVVPNIPVNIDNTAFNSGVLPSNFNVGFSNSVPPGLVQLPCNTVIMPQAHEPSQPILQVPQNSFFNAPLELAPGAQLSYVGSVTVTNNDTMTFQLNMPDQIMPIFPQPNINFTQPTIIPNSMQMQQTGIQLSTFNLQQLSLQGAFTTNSLNQVIFPQEGVNMPQNQVYLIGDPISHPLPSNSQAPNFVFQVPVSQSENSFIPPQQFVNHMTFNSNAQNLIDSSIPEQPKKPVSQENDAQRPDCMPELKPQIVTNNNSNQRTTRHGTFTNSPMASPEPAYSPTCIRSNSTASSSSCTTTPSVSNRSTPVPDSQSAPLSLTSNSKIMEFLKKAAEQVLSLSEKRKAQSQEQKADSGAPEKKTRFAHTRKVAARRAEKLKLQKTGPSSVNKPKTVHLNIATLKTIPIPVVPIINEFSEMNQPQAPSLEVPPPQSPSPVIDAQSNEQTTDSCERSHRASSKVVSYKEDSDEEEDDFVSDEEDSILLRIQKHETKKSSENGEKTKPYIVYEISCEDGFSVQSHNIRDAWEKVYDTLQDSRIANYMKQIPVSPQDIDGYHLMGLDNSALVYLVEQLPGAHNCKYYDFIFHKPTKEAEEIITNATGCARSESYCGRREYDMFNFLASEHRIRPIFVPPEDEDDGMQKATRRSTNLDMPIALRFRNLKSVARETVGVYRSSIHGRGLFCKRNIDAGELVIEYAGEVIRSVLTDKRERIYQSKGIGCYMFRIDDDEVVDATMHGNAARFINHSCEPNCFSKVITVDGKKHIVIFALRRISKGEELTYDYKFPFEEEKIPCHCNSRKCRKYLN